MNRTIQKSLVALTTLLLPFSTIVSAGPGGGNHSSRGSATSSVNRSNTGNRNSNTNSNNSNVNRNTNVNTNKNVNVNSNKNVNVNVDNNRGGYYGGYGYNSGCCYHQSVGGAVATAAAVTATSMVTAAVVGSMVNTLPPSCSSIVVNGIAYQQCGSTWYQPQFAGGNTTYMVINPPR